MIAYTSHEVFTTVLTPEGSTILSSGSHEARVFHSLSFTTPISPVELKKLVGDETAKVGQGRAFKNGWIKKDKSGAGLVRALEGDIVDKAQVDLKSISEGKEEGIDVADYKKRKLVVQRYLSAPLFSHSYSCMITSGKDNGSP